MMIALGSEVSGWLLAGLAGPVIQAFCAFCVAQRDSIFLRKTVFSITPALAAPARTVGFRCPTTSWLAQFWGRFAPVAWRNAILLPRRVPRHPTSGVSVVRPLLGEPGS
jgi:hypothetical protein